MNIKRFLRLTVFSFSILSIASYAMTSYGMADQKPEEKSAQTQGHAKKKGSDVPHYVVDKEEQAKIEGDLSEGKGHGVKSEDAEHFDQGEAARESAESGETIESHPHSHKEASGTEHYEPNK